MKWLQQYKIPFIVGLICIAMAALFLNLTRTNPSWEKKDLSTPIYKEYKMLRVK